MSYSLVTSTSKSDVGSGVTTNAIDTSGANLIVVAISFYNGNSLTITFSDSKSNSWTSIAAADSGVDSISLRMYYCFSPTVGSGHTFTAAESGFNTYPAIFVLAFSGAATSPFDQSNVHPSTGQVTSLNTNSVTPTENNELLVAGLATHISTGHTIDSGFTATTLDYDSDSIAGGIAYKIQTTLAAQNPTWSWSGSYGAAACIATFKAASGGGGGGFKSAWARGSNQVLGV